MLNDDSRNENLLKAFHSRYHQTVCRKLGYHSTAEAVMGKLGTRARAIGKVMGKWGKTKPNHAKDSASAEKFALSGLQTLSA